MTNSLSIQNNRKLSTWFLTKTCEDNDSYFISSYGLSGGQARLYIGNNRTYANVWSGTTTLFLIYDVSPIDDEAHVVDITQGTQTILKTDGFIRDIETASIRNTGIVVLETNPSNKNGQMVMLKRLKISHTI
jgi:hypothetical protein